MLVILLSLLFPILITVLVLDILPYILKVRKEKFSLGAEGDNISFDGPFKVAIKKMMQDKLVKVSLHILIIIILLLYIGPTFAVDPEEIDLSKKYLGWFEHAKHPFGTDQFGRDIYAASLVGGQTTIYIAIMVTIISLGLGLVIGAVAGYFGGKIDWIISRFIEVVVSVPFLVTAMVISAVVAWDATPSQKVFYLILILGFLRWTGFARLIRGQVMQIRSMEYITATKSLGLPSKQVIVKHVIPGVMPYILIRFTLSIAFVTLTESGLSFLGIGADKDVTRTWGNLLAVSRDVYALEFQTWLWVPAMLFILVTILSANIVGDGLTKAFDQKEGR